MQTVSISIRSPSFTKEDVMAERNRQNEKIMILATYYYVLDTMRGIGGAKTLQ